MLTIVQILLAILTLLCFGYAIKRVVCQKKIDCLLFLILAAIMVVTRKVDWYQLSAAPGARAPSVAP